MQKSEYEKEIIAGMRKVANENGWEDILYLSMQELAQMYPVADFEAVYFNPNKTLESEYIASLVANIEKLQGEIDTLEQMLSEETRSSICTEIRSDISYLRQQLVAAQEKYEELTKHERNSRPIY